MIRRLAPSLLLACAPLHAGAIAADDPALPGPGVRIERVDGWDRVDAVLPGALVSYALPRIEGGGRRIVLLVRPSGDDPSPRAGSDTTPEDLPCTDASDREGRPLVLYRIEPTAPDGLEVLHEGLPHDITAIDAVDLERKGGDELLLARPGELFLLDREGRGEIESVLIEPDLGWRSLHPRPARAPELDGLPFLQTHAFGRLGIHGPGGGGGSWTRLADVDLPLAARVTSNGMWVRSLSPRFIGRGADDTLLFGMPAEIHGQRLHTRLIEVAASREVQVIDSWSRLPAPEAVLEQHFLMLDDQPMLLVTTKTSQKLNLFGEKQLRLFPVKRDISRLGRNPQFAASTRVNLWQEVTPIVVDVNGDGRNDLVLGYWKGLKDDRVVLDAYLMSEEGTFEEKPRTTAFNVKDGDRSFVEYGRDLDADGLADLLLRTEDGRLWLYGGLPSAAGKRLVDSKPRELPLGDAPGEAPEVVVAISIGGPPTVRMAATRRPRVVDLDGDGHSEVLVVQAGGRKQPGRLLTLSAAGSPP